MEQPLYTSLKVNNEILLCEISDMDVKRQVERVLLRNRISYFVRWNKPGFFRRRRETCIFCINDNDKSLAENAIRSLGKDVEQKVTFLMSKSPYDFF